jgi:hypothetical protein
MAFTGAVAGLIGVALGRVRARYAGERAAETSESAMLEGAMGKETPRAVMPIRSAPGGPP